MKTIIAEAGGSRPEDEVVEQMASRYDIRPTTTLGITRTKALRRGAGGGELNPAAEKRTGKLEEQADGFSDEGEPYVDWHARGTRARRRGLRIHDIPEAVAHHAGARPDTTSRIAVTSPAIDGGVTLSWKTANQAPITLRQAEPALKAIETRPGDLIRITFRRTETMSFENLGPVDESKPEARNTSRGDVPKAKGPAGTVLNELIVDLLVRRRWAIHTAAARKAGTWQATSCGTNRRAGGYSTTK